MAKPRSLITKGRNFQKKIMLMFQECFSLDEFSIRTPVGSENGPDVIFCNEAALQKVGLAIECKNVKKISIWECLEQAKSHAKNTKMTPALVFHRSAIGNTDIFITVPLSHYLELRSQLLQKDDIIT